jgi:hypothetical protein
LSDVVAPGVLKSEIIFKCSDDVSRDFWTNTIYHKMSESILNAWASTDYANHAAEVLAVFKGTADNYTSINLFTGFGITVNVFDLGDAGSSVAPRQPHASVTYTPASGSYHARGDLAAAQVAVVLSFSGGGNVPGHRGRIYLGEWPASLVQGPYVPSNIQNMALTVGHALFDVGGENVAHAIFHPKATLSGDAAGSVTIVDTYHVSNEWAIQRRRGLRATSKVTLTP